jgi:hypothetical protein
MRATGAIDIAPGTNGAENVEQQLQWSADAGPHDSISNFMMRRKVRILCGPMGVLRSQSSVTVD